jgi:hypothetical protein
MDAEGPGKAGTFCFHGSVESFVFISGRENKKAFAKQKTLCILTLGKERSSQSDNLFAFFAGKIS